MGLQDPYRTDSQLPDHCNNTPSLLIGRQTFMADGGWRWCGHKLHTRGAEGVCVPRHQFQSCSNCEVRHLSSSTTIANHEFGVLPCRGVALSGGQAPYEHMTPTQHGSWSCEPHRETTRHISHARVRYRSPQTVPMHPRKTGGGGVCALLGWGVLSVPFSLAY